MISDESISLARNVQIGDDAIFRELGDEAVVLNLASGMYFGLNVVALRMWQLIDRFGSLQAVRDAVLSEFDVDAETATRDVTSLVGELSARGLVKIS